MSEKESDQLEPQQYQRLYWEADVPVRDLRVQLMRRLLYAALVLFAGLCTLAAVVRFPDQVELPFVLKSDIREEVYKFPYTTYLLDQFAQTGDTVRPGDSLIRISSPEIVALINRYNETKFAGENFNGSKRTSVLRQQEIIRATIRENNLDIGEHRNQLELARQTWAAHEQQLRFELRDATDKLDAYKTLYESQTVSHYDLIEKENRKIQVENALKQENLRFEKENARLKAAINRLLVVNQAAESQLAKSRADFLADSLQTGSNFDLAQRRIANTFGDCNIRDGAVVIKSPIAGRVSFLFEGEKEIPGGSTALKVNNANEPTFAFVKCPPAMAGKLKNNQTCHLKVFSFPFYEYGSVGGHIRQISLTTDEKGDYNLNIALDDEGQLKGRLQPGFTGTAAIVIEEKTLFQYFFRHLKKQYHRFLEGDAQAPELKEQGY